MIPVDQAYRQILSSVPEATAERLSTDMATGRVLLEPVSAERDAPPFDRVMMDGYAIKFNQPLAEKFHMRGIALAGHDAPGILSQDDCIEVTTGCPLPNGCDTVVPVEDCIKEDSSVRLTCPGDIRYRQFIHPKGSDGTAGREVLPAGTFLGPPEMAVLATEGVHEVAVGKLPRIGLVTTGDEILVDGQTLGPSQIRGSHFEALRGLFHGVYGLEMTRTHAGDNQADLLEKLQSALSTSDILLITGGVSKGRKDLVPELLEKLGVRKILHRVSQRPGKPIWFGSRKAKLVFGLPGNPISTLVCARRYVVPVMEKWMGANPRTPMRISLVQPVEQMDEFTRFIPVRIQTLGALAESYSTSGSLHDLAGTDGFVEVPPKGPIVDNYEYFPWRF